MIYTFIRLTIIIALTQSTIVFADQSESVKIPDQSVPGVSLYGGKGVFAPLVFNSEPGTTFKSFRTNFYWAPETGSPYSTEAALEFPSDRVVRPKPGKQSSDPTPLILAGNLCPQIIVEKAPVSVRLFQTHDRTVAKWSDIEFTFTSRPYPPSELIDMGTFSGEPLKESCNLLFGGGWRRLEVKAPVSLEIRTKAIREKHRTSVNPEIVLFNEYSEVIDRNDDFGLGRQSRICRTFDKGVYYVFVGVSGLKVSEKCAFLVKSPYPHSELDEWPSVDLVVHSKLCK